MTRQVASRQWPWIFVAGLVAGFVIGALVPTDQLRQWAGGERGGRSETVDRDRPRLPAPAATREEELVALGGVHAVRAVYVIDGDTFVARLRLPNGQTMRTRIRLRGVDTAEMKANCDAEQRKAESARAALMQMLAQGDVTIFNIGPDKYDGRVVADVATRDISNVSQALIARGEARVYSGGYREGWCD